MGSELYNIHSYCLKEHTEEFGIDPMSTASGGVLAPAFPENRCDNFAEGEWAITLRGLATLGYSIILSLLEWTSGMN